MTKRIIIGIVGPPGAGKTTVAKYLTKLGFVDIKLSSFLEKKAEKKYGRINRESLQDVGNEFRTKYGPAILAKWAIEKAKKGRKIVVDGIRNIAEINFLKKQDDFCLLGLTANSKRRFKRLAKIKTKTPPDWKEFLRLDARDKGRGQSDSGLQVTKCLKRATYVIENNGTVKSLYQKIDRILNFYK